MISYLLVVPPLSWIMLRLRTDFQTKLVKIQNNSATCGVLWSFGKKSWKGW